MVQASNPLRVGVGGPVGSGKTTLVEMLCKRMRERFNLAVVTNDIYTKEDERLLVAADALPAERIMGVETEAARTRRYVRTHRSILKRLTACINGSPIWN